MSKLPLLESNITWPNLSESDLNLPFRNILLNFVFISSVYQIGECTKLDLLVNTLSPIMGQGVDIFYKMSHSWDQY